QREGSAEGPASKPAECGRGVKSACCGSPFRESVPADHIRRRPGGGLRFKKSKIAIFLWLVFCTKFRCGVEAFLYQRGSERAYPPGGGDAKPRISSGDRLAAEEPLLATRM